MNSHQNNREESILKAMELGGLNVVPSAISAAIKLNLFEIIAKAGGPDGTSYLSSADLASRIKAKNPDAPMMIDRLLCFLASYSVVTCKFVEGEDGKGFRVYGLGQIGRHFVKDEDGVSVAPWLIPSSIKVLRNSWPHLAESILEGEKAAFDRGNGKPLFEYMAIDESFRNEFNELMSGYTKFIMKNMLQIYDGFESLNDAVLVDVGGGIGSNLGIILSKYPRIKGINFDLPQVIKAAPHVQGVEHIAGDMFKEIPKAQAIFMKWILHDWSDEKCIEILKNCWKALPTSGKVILFEAILSEEVPDTDLITKNALNMDMIMMVGANVGGKERSKKEFEMLAREAGFAPPKIVCGVYSFWIIELYKN